MLVVISDSAMKRLDEAVELNKKLLNKEVVWLHELRGSLTTTDRNIEREKLMPYLTKIKEESTYLKEAKKKRIETIYLAKQDNLEKALSDYVSAFKASKINVQIKNKASENTVNEDKIVGQNASEKIVNGIKFLCNFCRCSLRTDCGGGGDIKGKFSQDIAKVINGWKKMSFSINYCQVDFNGIIKKNVVVKFGNETLNEDTSVCFVPKTKKLKFEIIEPENNVVEEVFFSTNIGEDIPLVGNNNQYELDSVEVDTMIDAKVKKIDVEQIENSFGDDEEGEGFPKPEDDEEGEGFSKPEDDEEGEGFSKPEDDEEGEGFSESEDDEEGDLNKKNSRKGPPPPAPPPKKQGSKAKRMKQNKPKTASEAREKVLKPEEDTDQTEEAPVVAKPKITFKKNEQHKYTLEEVKKGINAEEAVPVLDKGKDSVVVENDQSIELDANEILIVTIHEEDGMRYKKCHQEGVILISTEFLEDIPGSVRLKFKLDQDLEEGEVGFTFEKVEYDVKFYYGGKEIDGYMSWSRMAYLAKKEQTVTLKNTSEKDLMIQCVWPNDMDMYFNKESSETSLLEATKVKLSNKKPVDFTFIPNNGNMKQGITTFVWKIQIYNNNTRQKSSRSYRAFRIVTINNPQKHEDKREQMEGNDEGAAVNEITKFNKAIKAEISVSGILNTFISESKKLKEMESPPPSVNVDEFVRLCEECISKIASFDEIPYKMIWAQSIDRMLRNVKATLSPRHITKSTMGMVNTMVRLKDRPSVKNHIKWCWYPIKMMKFICRETIKFPESETLCETIDAKTYFMYHELSKLKARDYSHNEILFIRCVQRSNNVDVSEEQMEQIKGKIISHHNKRGKKGHRFLNQFDKGIEIKGKDGRFKISAMPEREKALKIVEAKEVKLSKLRSYSNAVILSRGFMLATGIKKVYPTRSAYGQICRILINAYKDIAEKQKIFNSMLLKKLKKTKHVDVAMRLIACYMGVELGVPGCFGTDCSPMKLCNAKLNYFWMIILKIMNLRKHIHESHTNKKLDWQRDTKKGGFIQQFGGLIGDINSVNDVPTYLNVLSQLDIVPEMLNPFKICMQTYVQLLVTTIQPIIKIIVSNNLIIIKESPLGESMYIIDIMSQRGGNDKMIDKLIRGNGSEDMPEYNSEGIDNN